MTKFTPEQQAILEANVIFNEDDTVSYAGSLHSVGGRVGQVWGDVGQVWGDVKGDIEGDVKGNIEGDVKGDVGGDVKGDVGGNAPSPSLPDKITIDGAIYSRKPDGTGVI